MLAVASGKPLMTVLHSLEDLDTVQVRSSDDWRLSLMGYHLSHGCWVMLEGRVPQTQVCPPIKAVVLSMLVETPLGGQQTLSQGSHSRCPA